MGNKMIRISFNNRSMDVEQDLSLSDLLNNIGKPEQPFALAVNMQFVPREKYAQWRLKEKDQVDLVVAMQGG